MSWGLQGKSASKHPTSLCLLGFSNLSENLRFGAHRAPGRPYKISGTSRGTLPFQIATQAERESCRSERKKGPLFALQGKKTICFDAPFRIYRPKTFKVAIEIDAPANRRRAEGCLHVLETAFTVQRALCTFTGKGQPGQSMVPIRLNSN